VGKSIEALAFDSLSDRPLIDPIDGILVDFQNLGYLGGGQIFTEGSYIAFELLGQPLIFSHEVQGFGLNATLGTDQSMFVKDQDTRRAKDR